MSPIWSAAGEEQSPYPCFECLENFPGLVPPRTFTTCAFGSRVEVCKGPWCDSTPSSMTKPPGRSRIASRSKPGTACRVAKNRRSPKEHSRRGASASNARLSGDSRADTVNLRVAAFDVVGGRSTDRLRLRIIEKLGVRDAESTIAAVHLPAIEGR